MRPSRRPLYAVLGLAALAGSSGCGDGPSGPPGSPPPGTVEVVTGAAQTGTAGQLLPDVIRVRVLDHDDVPAAFTSVVAEGRPGGGRTWPATLRTDGLGEATLRWRLADEPGPHVLEVAAPEVDARVEVHATGAAFPDVDAVRVAGWSGDGPIGAVVSGFAATGPARGFRFVGEGPTLGIGDWRESPPESGGGPAEVAVFRPGAAFLHRPAAAFSAGSDTLDFEDEPAATLDLTVWMAAGSRSRVEEALRVAEEIFHAEGLGVTLDSVEFVEDVKIPAELSAFTCLRRNALEAEVGRREGRINVYVVERVDGSLSRGQACEIGGSFVALGREAGPTLLAHEIGHNLSLLHVDHLGDFDITNVMHSASDSRASLSEGQVQRAQLNGVSVLNATFGHRDPSVWRSCVGQSDPTCPPLELRLWADGPFGPWPASAMPAPAGTENAVPGEMPTSEPLPTPTCALEVGPAEISALDSRPPDAPGS